MAFDPQCRQKRMALGLPYPRSSCAKCGTLIRVGWQCPEEPIPPGHIVTYKTPPSLEDRVAALEDLVAAIDKRATSLMAGG